MSKSNPGRPWTPAEEAELRVLYADGLDFDVIGRRMNRGPASVRSKVHKSGFRRADKRVPWTQKDEQELARLWRENMPTEYIMEKLGRTRDAIFNKARDFDLGKRDFSGKSRPPIERNTILKEPSDPSVTEQLRKLNSARHLIDFKRSGYTAAYYKATCEMPAHTIAVEPCLYHNEQPRPRLADFRTFMSSTAAMCAEVS